MNESNHIVLETTNYNEIYKVNKVLNVKYLEYYIYAKLDPTLSDKYFLYDVREVVGSQKVPKRAWINAFVKDSPTWIKINTSLINTEVGQHIYKLSFVNRENDITCSQYICYTIQEDNPDTPYIYMNRENKDEKFNCCE